MKYNEDALVEFCRPYYENKDIMHDMWHIELVRKWVDRLIHDYHYAVDYDLLLPALYFHGFIYSHQSQIEAWLGTQGYPTDDIRKITKIAWESQRPEIPETLEGKVLHDAHVLEGGKTYTAVKTLITGSVRGQTLLETLDFMEQYVLGKNVCYLPETIKLCREMNDWTLHFFEEIKRGIQ